MKHNLLSACVLLCSACAGQAQSSDPAASGPQLFCHRTANKDVPENTLASLEQAALLGCNVVELDVRRTLDGKLVLNHDGVLERLTDGTGDVENTYFGDLERRDAGSWMGERFTGMRIALFEDALRLARSLNIRLIVDIKTHGIGLEVLTMLTQQGMLDRVQFNGEWADVKKLYPAATDAGDHAAWVRAGVTTEQVKEFHRQGKSVIANFSDTPQEMDLTAMKAAVAAGVDGLNVDYPRLGAEAVGRPVEAAMHALILQANAGSTPVRAAAILQLSRYRGSLLQDVFMGWLTDPDDHVSRAAALTLVSAQPRPKPAAFAPALHCDHWAARLNAAWALGEMHAPAATLRSLLHDADPRVLQQVLMSLAKMPGDVPAPALLKLLSHTDPRVRGAAALTLAQHHPEIAGTVLAAQLRREMDAQHHLYADYAKRKPQTLTPAEIASVMDSFRCQMKLVQALSRTPGRDAFAALEEQAFRPGEDFSQMNALVAGFDLWDRIGMEPRGAVDALGSSDMGVANRAEWMLTQGGPAVLPAVRVALNSAHPAVRQRAIRIVSLQGDAASLGKLRIMQTGPDATWARDAVKRIQTLR